MQSKGRQSGKTSLGGIMPGIFIAVIVVALFLPLLLTNRVEDMESGAIRRLQTVVIAEEAYRYRQHPHIYGTFEQLAKEGLIDSEFVDNGYRIETVGTPGRDNYAFKAVILRPEEAPNMRSFYVDQTAVIRAEKGPGVTGASPAIPLRILPRNRTN